MMAMEEFYHQLDALYQKQAWEEATALVKAEMGQYDAASPAHAAVLCALGNELGMLLMNAGRMEEAEQALLEARAVSGEPAAPELANTLCNLATLYDRQGRFAESRELLRTALDIYDDRFGHNSAIYYHTVIRLGTVYQQMGEPELAVPYFQIGFDICNARGEYAAAAGHMLDMGMSHIMADDPSRAIACLEQAAGICTEKELRDSEVYRRTVEAMQALRCPC